MASTPTTRAASAFWLVARIAVPSRLARVQRAVGVTPEVVRTTADDPLLAGRGWKVSPLLDLRKVKT